MPPTNEAIGQRTKVQKLDKASTVIKKKQPPQKSRRLLEQSFAKMNAELARKSSSLSSSSSSLLGLVVEATDKKQKPDNIFMDILKIAPVIDLASEEHRATLPAGNDSIDIEAVEQEEEILAQQPTSSTASTTIVQKEAKILGKKKKLLQKGGGGCLFENILKEPLPIVNASPGSKSDLDLREEIGGALKKTKKSVPINQLEPSTSKSRHTQMQPRPTTQNDSVLVSSSFISRVRMCILAPPIDLTKHYQLHGLRYFQEISGNQLDQCDYQPVPLRVVSFNVLCQKSLMDVSYLYSYLRGPRGRLTNWAERQPKLELEFQRLDADIFCLQEVQDCHYEQFYLPYFTNRGYLGEFTRRTGEQTPDGCALFWRPQRLLLIHLLPIEYNLHVDTMNRDNVGQIAVFGVPGHRSAICISNTHIYFNMKRGEVKLAQLAYLLSSMHRVEQQFRNKQISSPLANIFTHFVGHILCGDFNMEPGSALHRFIVNQRIDLHLERTGLAFCSTNTYNNNNSLHQQQQLMSNYLGSNSASIGRTARPIQLPVRAMAISGNCTFVEKSSNALMNMNCGELTHGFKLASVYEHRNALGEKELSTYHRDEGQPDYIFYSVFDQREMTPEQDERPNADNNAVKPTAEGSEVAHESYIQLRKRLSLPTRAQMNNACGPIPNEQYGSDHLSLCAVFDILCLPQK